jgi:hypothetical protein
MRVDDEVRKVEAEIDGAIALFQLRREGIESSATYLAVLIGCLTMLFVLLILRKARRSARL